MYWGVGFGIIVFGDDVIVVYDDEGGCVVFFVCECGVDGSFESCSVNFKIGEFFCRGYCVLIVYGLGCWFCRW